MPTARNCAECGKRLTALEPAPYRVWLGGLLLLVVITVILWQRGLLLAGLTATPTAMATTKEGASTEALISEEEFPNPTSSATFPVYATSTMQPAVMALEMPTPTQTQEAEKAPSPSRTATIVLPSQTPTPTIETGHEFTVDANQMRNDTGVEVVEGSHVRIEYVSGSWQAGPNPTWPRVGPEGDEQVLSKSTFPLAGTRMMTLVGGIGEGQPFLVSRKIEFISRESGRLWLGANDDDFADNSGDIVVEVQVSDPASESTRALPSGRIVFTCFIEDYDEICTIMADGSNERRLTRYPATDWYASFSPDGQGIIFSSRRDGNFELYLMNTDGTDQLRLTRDLGGFYAPEISPDSQRMVFTLARDNSQNIWTMSINGNQLTQLTSTTGNNEDPIWSPDGSQIAFASDRTGRLQHFIMNSDGSSIHMLSTDVENIGGRSDWSPDGQWLAFYAGNPHDRNIYLVATDGSQMHQLTYGGNNVAPSFSPDGEWITFMSKRDGDAEIFVMRVDGSDVTQLTFNGRPDWQPRWGR